MWTLSRSDTANLLMTRVKTAIEAKDLDLAIKLLDGIVKEDRRRRSGLRHCALAVGRLAVGEDTAARDRRRIKILHVAAGLDPRFLHPAEGADRCL